MPAQFVSFPRRFIRPPVSSSAILNPAALDALDAALATPLTLVFGPVGLGKTTVLASWLERSKAKHIISVWHRAETEDLDFPVFASEWLNQLQSSFDGNQSASNTMTSLVTTQEVDACLAALHDTVASFSDPVITVIDNFDVLDVQLFTRSFLRAMRLMPVNLHVILVSSTFPDFLVKRQGGVIDMPIIGPEVLALGVDDVAAQLPCHRIDAGELRDATAGWPAVLALVAEQLRRDSSRTLEQLLDADSIHTYVTHQLLGGLNEDTRRAMIGLATIERVPLDLAAAVVGEEGAEQLLVAANLLQPLFRMVDQPAPCFECHPILGNSLRRLRVRLPARIKTEIDRAAVAWFVERHDVAAALTYALQQCMSEELIQLVEYFGPHTITMRAGVPLLRAAFESIPAEKATASVRLVIGRATVLMKDGRFALAAVALDEAARLLAGNGEWEGVYGSPHVDLVCARHLMMLYNNDAFDESFISDEQAEIRQLSVEDGIVGFIYALRSIWFQRHSSFRRSEIEAARSMHHYRNARSYYGEASVLLVQGLAAIAQGRLRKAEQAYDEAAKIIRDACPADPGLNATCAILLSEVRYERNEIAAAEEAIGLALSTLEESDGWLDPYAVAYRVAVGVSLARADAEGADIYVDRAFQLAAQRGLAEIERLAQLQRAQIQLHAQNWDEAEISVQKYNALQSLSPRGQATSHEMAREQEQAILVRSRLLIGRGESEAAANVLCSEMEQAEQQGRYLQLTRLTVLLALAHWKQENDRAASSALRQSIELAAGKGYVRLFVERGTELVPILRRLTRGGELPGAKYERLARELMRAIDLEHQTAGPTQQFSGRELQVISYLSRGLSNKQIARQLDVTESTIKFHLKKIFTRLGVNKRASAIVEARRLGLI